MHFISFVDYVQKKKREIAGETGKDVRELFLVEFDGDEPGLDDLLDAVRKVREIRAGAKVNIHEVLVDMLEREAEEDKDERQ